MAIMLFLVKSKLVGGNMQNGKDLFASKTTWGALIPLLMWVLSAVGVPIPDIDEELTAQTLANISGGLLFLWGQLTRKAPITTVAGVPLPKGGA
jgi:hypothetical protein